MNMSPPIPAVTAIRGFASSIAALNRSCRRRCGRRTRPASGCSSITPAMGVPVIIDRLTGEIRKAQIFVAVLGASSFTFAHASWTQALPDWIDAHIRALEVIGGVPHLLVPDNTKTAVIKACLYDPQVNRTDADIAAQYTTAILPSRAT